MMMSRLMTPLFVGIAVFVGVAGQFLLKAGMEKVGRVNDFQQVLSRELWSGLITQWQVPVAVVMYAAGAFLWMIVLSRESVSYAYPFLGLTYVLILLVDRFVFGEQVGVSRWIGTALVASGILLVARS